jgi:nucleotide-binding universal stress UspA family protein
MGEIRLLYVEVPDLLAADVRSQPERAEKMPVLQSARDILDAAGVPYVADTRRGFVAQEIAAYAKDNNCAAVVMGTRGMGRNPDILGSIARQVVYLVEAPVTLVK